MNLSEIKEYTHPIRKINIYNDNRYSLRKKIVLKVNPDAQPDETVRFSLEENDEFIGHQKEGNDYYIRVPNNYSTNEPVITTIYAHYFPKDLYTYENDIQVFSKFDLYQIANINQNKNKYQITYKNYEENKVVPESYIQNEIQKMNNSINEEEKEQIKKELSNYKPMVQSLFNDNNTKDPNYKNYNTSDNDISPYHMREKGKLPLSSHYRSSQQFLNKPNLNDHKSLWHNDEYPFPYWEVKIHRELLSPLISDGVENTDEDTPLNVFLNYNYLQTSTDYHQHQYGFEDYQEYNNKYYNIFEGENINKVNENFGNDNNYRIIQLGNPYNDIYSIKIDKEKKIPFSLDNINDENLEYNTCKKYYTYSGDTTSTSITLQKDKLYSLKYYIYIPNDVETNIDSCYINVNENKISDEFLYKDKSLRNEWIYHEVPFTGQDINTITIVGANNGNIYLYNTFIEEMVEYSPTIKYNERGISVVEENQGVTRPLTNQVETPITKISTNIASNEQKLPIPHSSVYFVMKEDDDFLDYDEYNMVLNYINYDEEGIIFEIENNQWTYDDPRNPPNIVLEYDENNMQLNVEYNNNPLRFAKGVNNNFQFLILDNDDQPVKTGRIKCDIHESANLGNIQCSEIHNPTGQCLDYNSYHTPNNKGEVIYNHINLSGLSLNENDEPKQYYLRIVYNNECEDTNTIEIRPCILEKEEYNITILSRNNIINSTYDFDNDDLPLQIQAQITNQYNNITNQGYCELFIDDKLIQSTIVDSNGIADFYLDLIDLKPNTEQIIKIIYYQEWNKSRAVKKITVNNRCHSLPAIPITIQTLRYKENNEDMTLGYENIYSYQNYIDIERGSPVFIDIDTKDHYNFILEIEAPNPDDNASVNIENKKNKSIIYCNHLDEGIQEDETYYIITKTLSEEEEYRENRIPIRFNVH